MLEAVDLTPAVEKRIYKQRLPELRRRLYDLQQAARAAGLPVIVLFEGWDAAGKSSAIKTLVKRLDPRGLQIYAIQAPRTYETHMPWLWRFWRKVPAYGEMAIFDTSWYRRVLLERVERLTPSDEWRRAYREIVSFERTLADDGYLIVKFFLHISKAEQERRFRLLEADPLRRWHVQTEYREHHHKYEAYVQAVEEMLARTHTPCCPWHLIAATDRRWTRITVFETLIRRMEEALVRRRAGRAAR